MALIDCPECTHRVSHLAKACPSCGFPVADHVRGENMGIGDKVEFGPYSWIVLEKREGKALIIAEDVLRRNGGIEFIPYHSGYEAVTWEDCSLRKWLNSSFLERFTAEERGRIVLSSLKNDDNPSFGTEGGADTEDRVFCLSIAEAHNFMNVPPRGASDYWWLRSPGRFTTLGADVYSDGGVNESGWSVISDELGVRPALWLTLR